ncbi:hypothetical protein CDG81_04310 [Actinopolyspora erythraea]|uniref:Uncharacterized protein n=1 Tax=Actinopolyspora erythraea TaxID=414996 RepID=A0A099D3L0_9ACTN|nr:hypothetical protein CDG81_04310 [Actinopolyspora erythraea]KGI80496.1 hypothetical protein IL38_16620 [Actinopolyspora erythraea]
MTTQTSTVLELVGQACTEFMRVRKSNGAPDRVRLVSRPATGLLNHRRIWWSGLLPDNTSTTLLAAPWASADAE